MIRIQNLGKTYRSGFLMKPKKALQSISLEVQAGEIFGFIGPNGAGKSTTIKLLTGLLRPSAGTIEVLGKSPYDPEARAQMGYLPEHPYFYDYLTGRELLQFFGNLSGLRGSLLKDRMEWALNLVHANRDWMDRRLRTYSKGMMQRVGLAQAILSQPKLLILDEPMSGLDPLGRRDVRNAILELNSLGTTIFYSSHVLSDVETLSHRIAMVVEGKIVRQGTIDQVTGDAGKEFRIRTATPLQATDLQSIPGLRTNLNGEYICADSISKDLLIAQCVQNQVSVERIESLRPSLEDALTLEVSKEGSHYEA